MYIINTDIVKIYIKVMIYTYLHFLIDYQNEGGPFKYYCRNYFQSIIQKSSYCTPKEYCRMVEGGRE